MSAAARLINQLGINVTGSDVYKTDLTQSLEHEGIRVYIGKHQAKNIPDTTDAVIYSTAVKQANPEIRKAKRLNADCFTYPEFIGQLMRSYIPIVVSGTHGKSTTTAMLAHIFIAAGLDPTVVLGTRVDEWQSNARLGLGRHFIVEGDEYREAFLNYYPVGLALTNIEADHLDYYKSIKNIIKAFRKLVRKVPAGGFIIANADDANSKKVITSAKSNVITYGMQDLHSDYFATHIIHHGELTRFAVKGAERFDIALRVPGQHNIMNAMAAIVMALAFGIEINHIQKGLLDFRGVWRRFEIKGETGGITVIDDYGHHPTEIKAVLGTARKLFRGRRIWCVYQPHSIDRTKKLLHEFSDSFADCDRLVLTEIYDVAGRDKKSKINIMTLREALDKQSEAVSIIKNYKRIPNVLKKKLLPGDVVIVMGAGTITEIAEKLLEKK